MSSHERKEFRSRKKRKNEGTILLLKVSRIIFFPFSLVFINRLFIIKDI